MAYVEGRLINKTLNCSGVEPGASARKAITSLNSISLLKAAMVEVVFVVIEGKTIELRAGPVRGSFPETIETYITTGSRD